MFTQMRGMMKMMAGQGMMGRMRAMQQMANMGMDGGIPKVKKGTTKYNPRRDDKKKRRKRRK